MSILAFRDTLCLTKQMLLLISIYLFLTNW